MTFKTAFSTFMTIMFIMMTGPIPSVAVGKTAPSIEQSANNRLTDLSCQEPMGSRTPVLLIHGYNSDAASWKSAIGTSNTPGIFCDSSTWATSFVYGGDTAKLSDKQLSYMWVREYEIGPTLAARIGTLADQSRRNGGPGKVVLIGHSLGGLAIRCALTDSCGHHGNLSTKVELIATIGTPNLGSFLRGNGSIVSDVAVDALTLEANAFCYETAFTTRAATDLLMSFCDEIRSMTLGPAALAFTPGSPQLSDLPVLPPDVALFAEAGSTHLQTTIFHQDITLGDVGDLVVGESSALAEAKRKGDDKPPSHQLVIPCGALNLTAFVAAVSPQLKIINGYHPSIPSCWHGSETSELKFLKPIKAAILNFSSPQLTPVSVAGIGLGTPTKVAEERLKAIFGPSTRVFNGGCNIANGHENARYEYWGPLEVYFSDRSFLSGGGNTLHQQTMQGWAMRAGTLRPQPSSPHDITIGATESQVRKATSVKQEFTDLDGNLALSDTDGIRYYFDQPAGDSPRLAQISSNIPTCE